MKRNNEDEEKISNYINELLSNQEKQEFEKEMNADDLLKKDVAMMMNLKDLHNSSKELWSEKQNILKQLDKIGFESYLQNMNEQEIFEEFEIQKGEPLKVVDEDTFAELIAKIIDECLPDESIAFEMAGEELIHDLFTGKKIKISSKAGELNFSENSKSVVSFINLILAAYEFYNEQKKTMNKSYDDLTKSWITNMIKKGIDKQLAQKIAAAYISILI